jgi:gluconolactonase
MTLDGSGRLLVCEHVTSTVVAMGPDGTGDDRVVLASHYEGHELNSPNDVVVGPDKKIWFTDPIAGRRSNESGLVRDPELDFQAVFRLEGDGVLTPMAQGFELCNGLAFTPDGTQLYVTDTYAAMVYMYPVLADGSLGDHEVFSDAFAPFREGDGWLDGIRCDDRGNVWTTGPGGVWVLDGRANILGRIDTPEIASNLTWGGPDGHTLFITATRSVYAIRTTVTSGSKCGSS